MSGGTYVLRGRFFLLLVTSFDPKSARRQLQRYKNQRFPKGIFKKPDSTFAGVESGFLFLPKRAKAAERSTTADDRRLNVLT
jgi:hypothetical protein